METLTNTNFASDNCAPVHPDILAGDAEINERYALGELGNYGNDQVTEAAGDVFRDVFGDGTQVVFASTGTEANVLGLGVGVEVSRQRQGTLSPGVIICADASHFNSEEAGAPTRTGAQLFAVPALDGKMTVELLRSTLKRRQGEGWHSAAPAAVSITNATETGSCYSVSEVQEIAELCHANGMLLHMDGSRLANAAVAEGLSLREYTRDAGVDILSFGGAKNGLRDAESVVMFGLDIPNHELLRLVKFQGQLTAKMAFRSGQFLPYLQGDMWHNNAKQANDMARLLADGLRTRLGDAAITNPETNQVFGIVPDEAKAALGRASCKYLVDWPAGGSRFVANWYHKVQDVEAFLAPLDALADTLPLSAPISISDSAANLLGK